MKTRKSILGGLVLLLLLLLSAVFSFGTRIDRRIPSWNDIYKHFGLAEQEEKGEVYRQPFTMSFLDVGQGSSTLIHCKDPELTVLIDTGEQGNDGVIRKELRRLGTRRIDYVVLTHPHSDHVGSFPELEESGVSIGTVLLPELDTSRLGKDEALYRVLERSISESGAKRLTATPGMRLSFDPKQDGKPVRLEVLGPVGGKENQSDNLNNRSVFLKVSYGDASVLITGDGEYEEEMDVIDWLNSDEGRASGITGKATFLVAGHHGSHTSSNRQFLAVVRPQYAIISCGKDNDFGHPHAEVLRNFRDIHAKVYRTDELGTIVFGTDGQRLVN